MRMFWKGIKQHLQILIMELAIPYNCLWHWIRTLQCAGLMSVPLQAIIKRWIWWLNPACIHLFSAIAQNHHPPSCNRIKLFVYMCHCRHSKGWETADKWFYWWHVTDALSPFWIIYSIFLCIFYINIVYIWSWPILGLADICGFYWYQHWLLRGCICDIYFFSLIYR